MALDMDPHILNFYEDLELKLSDIPRMIHDIILGDIADVKEKLDGQNFTFTVDTNRRIKFMGKGCPKWLRAQGGLDRRGIHDFYADKPQVQSAFMGAYDALQRVIDRTPQSVIDSLFENGLSVVSTEVVTPINPNIVKYDRNTVCILGVQRMGTKLGPGLVQDHLLSFQDVAHDIGTVDGWTTMAVPIAVPKSHDVVIQQLRAGMLKQHFEQLCFDVSSDGTMGDLVTHYVKRYVADRTRIRGHHLTRAAKRLAYEDSRFIRSHEFASQKDWEEFKPLDDERALVVGEAILPIEKFFRRLGAVAIDSYQFTLADVDDHVIPAKMRQFVKDVKAALLDGRVVHPSSAVIKRIKSAAERVEEDLFDKNVEGIVFPWGGKLKKLTGQFTGINRLHGYFAFGDRAIVT